MKNSIVVIILALILSFSIMPAYAENTKLIFSSEEWKDATNKDGTGLYWDIFRAVYEPEGYEVNPKIRSYQGSINLLKRKNVDVMVAAYKDEIENVVYSKNHFAVDIVQVIYLNSFEYQWKGIDTIKGKRVGWIKGYLFNDYLPGDLGKDIQIRRINDRDIAFHLLNIKRIDFFMDALTDLNFFLKNNDTHKSANYTRKTILELKLYLVFSDGAKGKKLAEIFDKRFSLLLTKGDIRKLYDKYKAANFTYPSDF